MSEKLDKMYSFKISEKMKKKMQAVSDKVENWSAWIRKQIKEKLIELEKQGGGELAKRFCPRCGNIVEEYDIFCGNCGEKLS